MEKYVLTLNREQAKIVSHACDLLSRLHIGQYRELFWEFLSICTSAQSDVNTVINNKEKIEGMLDELRSIAFPSRINNPNYDSVIANVPVADNGYNIHQVIRYTMAYHDHPEGGDTVNFHKPIQLGKAGLPKCEVVE